MGPVSQGLQAASDGANLAEARGRSAQLASGTAVTPAVFEVILCRRRTGFPPRKRSRSRCSKARPSSCIWIRGWKKSRSRRGSSASRSWCSRSGSTCPYRSTISTSTSRACLARLSFNRAPHFCHVPWKAIYALVAEDGRGMLWPEDIPPEVSAQAHVRTAQPAQEPRAHLHAVPAAAAKRPAEARPEPIRANSRERSARGCRAQPAKKARQAQTASRGSRDAGARCAKPATRPGPGRTAEASGCGAARGASIGSKTGDEAPRKKRELPAVPSRREVGPLGSARGRVARSVAVRSRITLASAVRITGYGVAASSGAALSPPSAPVPPVPAAPRRSDCHPLRWHRRRNPSSADARTAPTAASRAAHACPHAVHRGRSRTLDTLVNLAAAVVAPAVAPARLIDSPQSLGSSHCAIDPENLALPLVGAQ